MLINFFVMEKSADSPRNVMHHALCRCASYCFSLLFKAASVSPAEQRIAIKGTDVRKSMCICFSVELAA